MTTIRLSCALPFGAATCILVFRGTGPEVWKRKTRTPPKVGWLPPSHAGEERADAHELDSFFWLGKRRLFDFRPKKL